MHRMHSMLLSDVMKDIVGGPKKNRLKTGLFFQTEPGKIHLKLERNIGLFCQRELTLC